jgi:hypothetical protein
MTVDDVRARLRPLLEREYGVDGAAYLIDRPQGGWSDLVTTQVLERELDALRQQIRADMADLRSDLRDELRAQTWQLSKLLIAAQGVVVAVIVGFLGVMGAVLRFA